MLVIWFVSFFIRLNSQFQTESNLREKVGKRIMVEGKISSEPILQGSSQRFYIGRVMVYAKQYPVYEYGQNVQISGTLQRKVVNKWYSRFSLMYPSIKVIKAESSKIMGLRRKIEGGYNQVLSEPEASLLAGIVLGSKRGLPREFYDSLQKTGTLHIVVASGFNVMIIISFVIKMFAGIFKRRMAVSLGILAVIGYVIMAGGEPAIVRAAIMGSLAFFGQVIGRKADTIRLLLATVMLMLIYSPVLIWDVGFQLSVAATLGLIFISPMLNGVFKHVFVIGEYMSETVSAQIMVWPILMIYFNSLSLFSVVVNSLILWLVPVLMTWGGVLALFSLVFTGGGLEFLVSIVGFICYSGLMVMVRVIEWFGKRSFITWPMKDGGVVEGLSWWWAVGYYIVLFAVIFRVKRLKNIGG